MQVGYCAAQDGENDHPQGQPSKELPVKIAVAGIGYVGLSNAVLLSQHHDVIAVDVSPERVRMLNARECPISDLELEAFLAKKALRLRATLDAPSAYRDAEFVIVATPTNYDPIDNFFDTSSVEQVIAQVLAVSTTATIVIKSTVPVGFTTQISSKMDTRQVIFAPEFLREGRALHDNLYPSRIIVGEQSVRAKVFADLLREGAVRKDTPVLFTDSSEAATTEFQPSCPP